MLPWNVKLWWQVRRLRLAVELDCDNRVVRALGDVNAYGSLLLAVAQASSRAPRPLRHLQRYAVPAMALVLLIVVLSMPHPVADAHATHTAPTAEAIVSAR